MIKDKNIYRLATQMTTIALMAIALFSCRQEDETLPSYSGSPNMSTIYVEQGTFKPSITWVGGYISVIGANIGVSAKLDASLIWLVKSGAEDIRYPVKFGDIPPMSQNLISQFGGSQLDSLVEDNTYTYWVLKGKLWNQISQYKGKVLLADKNLPAESFEIKGDTVKISQYSFVAETKSIDVFTNIKNLQLFGRLGKIKIEQAVNNKGPKISWEVTQSGVTDTRLSAIGIVMGQSYSQTNQIWEVWSDETVAGVRVYGKKNLISAPLYAGSLFSGTRVFQKYPEEGLIRNKDYYIWIANSSWDGKTHGRTANGYAFAYFRT
ncbi:MAG: hypothetical protein AB1394_12320, partial [Bacteroidota bacterium]